MLGQALLSAFKLAAGGRLILAGLDGLTAAVRGAAPQLAASPSGPPRLQLHRVYSLADRIRFIKQQARKGKLDPNIYQLARSIVTKKCGDKWCTPAKDPDAEVVAVFDWVRANVRYTHDIEGVDTYQTPQRTISLKSGDCLPEGTLIIRAPYDLVPIEEIKQGDVICDGTGWTRVVQQMDKGERPLLCFSLNNGCVLRCTEDHRVFVVPTHACNNPGQRGEEVETLARDVRVRDDLLQPATLPAGRESWQDERALIVGAYLAEGWLDAYRACIAGVPEGNGLRERVVASAAALGIKCHERGRYVELSGASVAAWLGACGRRALQKALPSLDVSADTAAKILEAMEQGDGGYAASGTTVYSTISYALALQHRILHRMLGHSTSIKRVDAHGGFGANPIYRCTVRSGGRRVRPWAKVRAISAEDRPARVYDIETESHRIYLPESDVIVHNCDDATSLLAALLGSLGYRVKGRVIQTSDADDWNHIFALVEIPSRYGPAKWSALDATMHHPAGWYPPDSMVARKADFDFD